MKRKRLIALVGLCFAAISLHAQYNVKNFGAKGDGRTLDTRFIQQAIDKAASARGGRVDVPAGIYKIGTLILKTGVELHLQQGAVLLGSPDYRDYTAVKQQMSSRTRDLYAKYFMLFAEGASDISITGLGTIHGNGLEHFQEERPQNLRPYMIRLVNCSNITVTGVRLLEAANWTFHLLNCKDVRVDGVVIENRGEGNRDGLDIDACERVTVANSRFSTTDDAIVMKATNDTLCRDITISNCVFHEIGGSAIKTGTESNGGFRNITVSNCVIKDIPVHAGIELMTVDGGMMQNILLENIAMEKVATPIFIRLGLRLRPYESGQYVQKVDEVRDIQLHHISAIDAKYPSSIIGLHSKKISNVTIADYTVRYAEKQDARAVNQVPFLEFDYPAAVMFENLPAYALYCRSVENLVIQNATMHPAAGDVRPAVLLDRTTDASLAGIKAAVNEKSPVVYLRKSSRVAVSNSQSFTRTAALIEAEQDAASSLRVFNNFIYPQQQEVANKAPLPGSAFFEDFKTSSKKIFEGTDNIEGLTALVIMKQGLKFDLPVDQRGSLQLCLLAMNRSEKPQKVRVEYAGIKQEFELSWNEWGWAPVTLLKQWPRNETVSFTVSAIGDEGNVLINRAYLRAQDIGFTD